jgi:hypothetical protein
MRQGGEIVGLAIGAFIKGIMYGAGGTLGALAMWSFLGRIAA